VTGAVSVTKSGVGTWVLSGNSSYTGTTTISAGTLLVNSPGSWSPASAVSVTGTATLVGNGTIGGNVTDAASANVSPGASPGTLSIGGNLDISALAGGAGRVREAETAALVTSAGKGMQPARMALAARLWQIAIPEPPPPDEALAEGQIITVGKLALEVLFTPGHAAGHVSFYLRAHNVLFDGDVLFQQSIGRTDLPGGISIC
jgi:autotransporter-associated beta strand protein